MRTEPLNNDKHRRAQCQPRRTNERRRCIRRSAPKVAIVREYQSQGQTKWMFEYRLLDPFQHATYLW